MNGENETIVTEAAAWHVASANDDMDWDGFTEWLEADPRHRSAYDEVALADALLDDHRDTLHTAIAAPAEETPQPAPANTPDDTNVVRPVFGGWRRWAGVAIAASLVMVLALPQFLPPAPAVYQTQASGRRIALADGSAIQLAPHSRLTVEGRQQDRMTLDGGAWFDIRHNAERPLAIDAGGVVISDIGTQFDVQADAGKVRVEVGQGEVKVAAPALVQPIRLTRGRGLLFDAKAGEALVSTLPDDAIGEWRSGHLSYDGVPLALVAADLSRYAGVKVTVADALRGRQFSGTLAIGNGEAALRDLSLLMDVELGRAAGGYRLAVRQR